MIKNYIRLKKYPKSSKNFNKIEKDLKYKSLLIDVVNNFQQNSIRVSLFINPSIESLINLKEILPDRVEFYTFDFAKNFNYDPVKAIEPYLKVVQFLQQNYLAIIQ